MPVFFEQRATNVFLSHPYNRVLLLYGMRRLQALRGLRTDCTHQWIQEPPLEQCSTHTDRRPFTYTEKLKLSRPANKVSRLVWRNVSFSASRKKLLNISSAFEKEHKMSFDGTKIVNSVDDMQALKVLTAVSRHAYYRFFREMWFLKRRKNVLPLIESLDGADTDHLALGISRLDDAGL